MKTDLIHEVRQNDEILPFLYNKQINEVLDLFDRVEFSDLIARPQDIRFEGDRIFIGKDESYRLTTPILEQIMNLTQLKKSVLKSLGKEKYIETLNYVFQDQIQDDFVLRVVDGAGYSLLKRTNRRFNPVNHKEFLNGVFDMVSGEFTDESLSQVTIDESELRVLITHPHRQFDIGQGDIQREGLEFRNNDNASKYSFHYHLLRTACTNSTILPHYFAAQRDSNEGRPGFERFIRDSLRMFEQGANMVPAYKHMASTKLSKDRFADIYHELYKMNKREANKLLASYLRPDLVTGAIDFNEQRIQQDTEFDLFNALTHNVKQSSPFVQKKVQEVAGQMILDIMKDQGERLVSRF